jgi:hypothetical protein
MKRLAVLGLLIQALSAQIATPTNPGVVKDYQPINAAERGKWFVVSTVGPASLFGAGILSSAWGTWQNNPEEYGPTWEGFGKRYGMRLTGVSTNNAIEAALGAAWGEDPRYFPSPDRAFGPRVKHVVKSTFLAPGRDGRYRPAYARYAANVGNNFLSNLWREKSEADASSALLRIALGVSGRMGSHAFAEFWPDVRKKMRR